MFTFIDSAWAQSQNAKVAVESSLISDILGAGPVVLFLLGVMILLSMISWAIMISKRTQVKNVEEADLVFEDKFWKAKNLQSVFESVDQFPNSAIARVFKSGYLELQRIAESVKVKDTSNDLPKLFGLDNLERALRKSVDKELGELENRLGFLATIGSTSPFIGLLGTVIGIMNSFRDIYNAGSASLATVAPGISEALFATAVGLFAAIPAVVAYNHFITRVRKREIFMNNFSSDFLNIAKRNFFRED